jgi:hypothetical protein
MPSLLLLDDLQGILQLLVVLSIILMHLPQQQKAIDQIHEPEP